MDAAAGRGRGAAEVDVARARAVRIDRPGRAHEELRDRMSAVGDVAAGVIRILALDVRWCRDRALEHAVAEARCEALKLRFDACRHVEGRAVWHVAVRPHGL